MKEELIKLRISYFLREKDAKEALNIFLKEMGYDNP